MAFAAPSVADAQELDLPVFSPSFAGDRFLGVPSAHTPSGDGIRVHAGLFADYAHNPLVIRSADGSPLGCGEDVCSVVEHQLFVHANATLSLFDMASINVDLPASVFQSGDGDSLANGISSPDGSSLGDLRIGARVRLLGDPFDALQLAVGGLVWLPTGASDAFVSDGSVRGQPQVIASGVVDQFVYSAMVGPKLRPESKIADTISTHQLGWGLGAGFLLLEDHALMVGLESTGAVSLASTELRNTNAEALAMAKYRFLSDFEVGAGVGPGFTSGIGTPDVRGVLSLQYTPAATRVEDRDGDGIVDALDACPDAAGVASDDPKKNGCPLPADRDKDGIVDADDACPDVPGVRSDDPKKNGCPPDKDGDGIVDAEDACPEVPGMKDADPKKNGCPKKAVVTESEIVILEQVQFDTNKATIKPISDALLDSIAQVLKEHPELKKLEVQGHTDNRGSAAANKLLSEARAKAVADALVKRGVEKQRLSSKGYGQTKPLDPGNNEAAWGKNRRVQFIVVEKAANAPEVKTP